MSEPLKLDPDRDAILEFAGGRMRVPSTVVFDVRHTFEQGEYSVPAEYTNPPRILDVGANVGAFSVWAPLRWKGATVTAVEPAPAALRYLRENAPHATILEHAVAKGGGFVELRMGLPNLGCSSIYRLDDAPENVGDEVVRVRAVDPSELPRAEVVKVDAEGIEPEFFAAYDLSETVIAMYEWHRREDRRLLEDLLTAKGFTLFSQLQRSPWLGTARWIKTSECL